MRSQSAERMIELEPMVEVISSQTAVSRLSGVKLLILNFELGFVGLGVEILTMRALAPIIGTSILATSFCIATVVLCLSFGYFLSSRSATKNTESLLKRNCALLALSLMVSPLLLQLLKIVADHDGEGDFGTAFIVRFALAGLIGPLLIGGIASVFVGTCSPLVLELMSLRNIQLRKATVQCFVVAGFGSLLGSLLPNFVLIPLVGVNKSLILLALMIGLTTIVTFEKSSAKKLRALALLVCGIAVTLGSVTLLNRQPSNTIVSRETSYQTIYLREQKFYGKKMEVLQYDDRLGVQSVYDPTLRLVNTPFYAGTLIFLNRFFDLSLKSDHADGRFRVLVLGSAGGTLSTQAQAIYGKKIPGLEITNVDIDPVVHELAQSYFGASNPQTKFVSEDARTFIEKTPEKYDYVMVDVFARGLYIPSEALSSEFFSSIKRILKPSGVVLFNLAAPSQNSSLIKVALGSLQKNFQKSYITDTSQNEMVRNYLVSASERPIDFEKLVWLSPPNLDLHDGFQKFTRATREASHSDMIGSDDSVSSEYLSLQMLIELWGKYQNLRSA